MKRDLLPADISRRAGGFQISECGAGWIVNYGGVLGSETYERESDARIFSAAWADERARKLDREAVNLRHAAALLRGTK